MKSNWLNLQHTLGELSSSHFEQIEKEVHTFRYIKHKIFQTHMNIEYQFVVKCKEWLQDMVSQLYGLS